MGGVTDARDVVFKALKKGKHVVTANKALLAQLLPEVGCLKAARCRGRRSEENAPNGVGGSVWGAAEPSHAKTRAYVGQVPTSRRGFLAQESGCRSNTWLCVW